MARFGVWIARAAAGAALWGAAAGAPALAQATLNERLQAAAAARRPGGDRLLVEAREIVYDNDRNRVSAVGNVELYYQGRTLQADRVTYDRSSGRVVAEGNARLTEANGAVVTGSRFELTEDFKSGFIDSLRVEQSVNQRGGPPVRTWFSAPRAERIEGETTIFERGTYTACEPCKEHPERPPLWQVKAGRIIHNNEERRIYYEDATVELAGIPVGYLPYFSAPDPTVRRETGFLAPHYVASTTLGMGAAVPFFWNLGPNYDLTLTPTLLSRQGVLGEAEWRHRLATGTYTVRAAGIVQDDTSAFLPGPLGAGDRRLRGSLESVGRFHLNERWRYGWDIALLSDKWFLNNYRIRSESLSNDYFRESISTAYLQGQGERSWFDLRGYYFKGLSTFDWQKQQPVVWPVLDYDKRVNGPDPIGGELALNYNFTHLTREATHFQGVPRGQSYLVSGNILGRTYPLYETCAVFEPGRCIVRGLAGDFSRMSTEVSWRRTFIDGAGQAWMPFAYLRTDGFWSSPDLTGYQNAEVARLFSPETDFTGRVMPAVGLEYRYPFVAVSPLGTHTVEPVAQIIARPSESGIRRLPNEDAQSLAFDDTSIFDWDKFSGYDRVEGGVRANAGAQYSFTSPGGFYANALVAQSFHLAGVNSFAARDIANVGRDSGLDTQRSDYVARLQVSPNANLSFLTRARFDQEDLGMKRLEIGATANLAPILPLSTALLYARYDPQPELGYVTRREGLLAASTYSITPNWFLTGSALFDLAHYLQKRELFASALTAYLAEPASATTAPTYRNPNEWYVSSMSLGAGYRDECTTFSVMYTSTPIETANGTRERNQTLLLRLELRTLGQANFRQNLSTTTTADGVIPR